MYLYHKYFYEYLPAYKMGAACPLDNINLSLAGSFGLDTL